MRWDGRAEGTDTSESDMSDGGVTNSTCATIEWSEALLTSLDTSGRRRRQNEIDAEIIETDSPFFLPQHYTSITTEDCSEMLRRKHLRVMMRKE